MVFLDEIPFTGVDAAPRGERSRLEGNDAFRRGDHALAANLYTASLDEAPPPSTMAAAVLGNRSATYLAMDRAVDALEDAERSVALSPAKSPYAAKSRFRLGNALVAVGRAEDARAAYRDALEHAPGDATILNRLRETSEAMRAATRETSASTSPSPSPPGTPRAPAVPNLADANRAFREGRHADALRMYDAAGPAPDREHAFLGNRSAALLALGRVDDALADARRCVRLEPSYVKGRYRLGAALNAAIRRAEPDASSESGREKRERSRRLLEMAREARDDAFGAGACLDPDSEEMRRGLAEAVAVVANLEAERTRTNAAQTRTPSPSPSEIPMFHLAAIRREPHDSERATAFRDAVRTHGCVRVRLPSPRDVSRAPSRVFADAADAAAAFFNLPARYKARHKPTGFTSSHGYRSAVDAARARVVRGANGPERFEARENPSDERGERFVVAEAYDAAYPWPSESFRTRTIDAHALLREVARIAGDALLRDARVAAEDEDAFDAAVDAVARRAVRSPPRTAFSPVECRPPETDAHAETAFESDAASNASSSSAASNASSSSAASNASSSSAASNASSSSAASRALMEASASVAAAAEATPQPAVVSVVPRASSGKATTARVRVRVPGRPAVVWPPADGGEDGDVALVVAGEWLRELAGEKYPAPAVNFERAGDETRACVRAIHRA